MELDATQALDTDYGDEEIEETEDRKIQVAELRMQKTKGFEPNSFIIHEGQNIVGRHEKADVYIPLKPLSKKHACIEVIAGQHFIYDFGSKNKTRRGKMILRPNVRYELTDGSQLLFADVKCEYKFIAVPEENDDTDSMSGADSESMFLIEDSVVGNENENGIESERSNFLQQEQPPLPANDSNSTRKEGGTEKQKLTDMTDEDIYAAETDSDTDNERDILGRATPTRCSQSTSIVKQTPGTLLHRMQRGSLNETADSTKLINDSMQSLEASNLSLKLDITQGSETALSLQTNRSKNDQSKSNEIATLVLQEELRPSTNQSSARIKDNQSPAEEIPTLVLHESSDETDDAETAKTGLLEFSDLSLSGAQSSRLKESIESKEADGLSEEPSARPKETVFLSTELSAVPKKTGGLLIQESDEESTDMSDNEAIKSDIAGSGFFSPDVLLQKYGMKKFDGASETDRSDVEIPFSPGVVRNSCDVAKNKQVMKGDNEGGGGNEESSKEEGGTSQEYILMPTQAYGVLDSDNDSTDVEDNGIADGNLTDNKNEKISASTENRQMKENRSQNFCSKIDESSLKAQMQDIVPSEDSLSGAGSALFPGLRTLHKEQTAATVPLEPTMPLEATIPLDSNVRNETALSDKLSPSREFSPAKHRIAPINKFSQTAETVPQHDSGTTEESNDSLTASALYDSMQEADTISMHDSEAYDKIMDKNASQSHSEAKMMSSGEQEAATVVVADSDQEAGTALQDADEHATTDPVRDIEQDAATVLLQDSIQEATIAPVHGSGQEASTVSLQNSAQEAATVPGHDSDQEAMTVQFEGTSSLEETVTLAETRNVIDDAALLQTAEMAPNQEGGEASDPSYNEEATQGYDILPPKKPVEKRRDKPSSETISTFTLPGGSTLKHVTWGAGAAKLYANSNQRERSNTESSVVAETQEDDESNTATQSYGYLDQPTLVYESPVASPSESKTGQGQETDIDDCATQAYGLLDQPTVPYDDEDGGSNENNSNDVDKTDDDDCATQAYGLLDQPTVPDDNEDGGSNENNPVNTNESADDDCATQAYGLLDQPTVTYDLQGDDQDDDSVMDECATQAYGLQDQPTQSYNLSPVTPAKDEEAEKCETAIDECETQAYGMEDDAIRHSDDEDCPTQAYGIMDLPTVPYEETGDSLAGDLNRRTDGGSHEESQDKTEDQSSESLFVKPTIPTRSQDRGSHGKSQDEMEDQSSESLFVTPAVPRRSRGKTRMAVSGGTNLNKETEKKTRSQPTGRRNLKSRDTNHDQNELDDKDDGTSSESHQTGKQNSKNRIRNKEESEPDITEDKGAGNSVLAAAEEHASKVKGRSKRSVRSKVSFEDDDRNIGDKEMSESEVTNESMQATTGAKADGRKKTASARRKTALVTKDTDAKQSADTLEKQHDIVNKERSCTEADQEDAGNMTGSAAVKAGRSTTPDGRVSTLKNLNKTIETVEDRVGVNGKDGKAEIAEVGKDSTEKEAASKTQGGKAVRRGRPSRKKRAGEFSIDEELTAAANESKTSSVHPPKEELSKKDKGRNAQRETAAAKRGRALVERTVVRDFIDEAKDHESKRGSAKLKETEASKNTKRETVAKRGRASAKRTVEEDLKDDDNERNNSKLKEEEASESENLKRNSVNKGGSAKKGRSSAKRTKEEADADDENNTNKSENEGIIETDRKTEASMRSTKSKTTKRGLATNVDKDPTKTTVSQNEQQTPTTSSANCSADEFDAKSSGGSGRKRGKQSLAMNQSKLSDTENSPGPSKKNAKEDSGEGNKSAKGRNSKGKGTASKLAEDSPTMKSPSLRPTLRALDEVPKIMFTGLTDKSVEKSVTQLGAELANSVYDATHLVTDKGQSLSMPKLLRQGECEGDFALWHREELPLRAATEGGGWVDLTVRRVRRTVKFLCCLARGIDIVEPSWLEHCRNAKEFTNAEKHIVKDKNTEKQYNFDLKRSIAKAKEKELLGGYSLYVTKNVKPDQKQMKDIIQCSGGKTLLKLPKNLDEKTLIISCEEDKTEIKNLTQSGIPVHTAELLLTGILRQELDFEQFRLEVGSESTKKAGKRTQSASELDKSVSSAKRRKR